MMTKHDYQLIAESLASVKPVSYPIGGEPDNAESRQWRGCVLALAQDLEANNNNFGRPQFLEAAGLTE